MSDLRVLRTAAATLTRAFYLDEGQASASGSVAVSVTRLDGTLVDSGTATPDGQGGYSFTFVGRDVLDVLVLTWTLTIGGDTITLDQDRIEVVGGFYFGLVEGRNVDRALADPVKYPTADLIDRRAETEAECERITGQAWVPRFCRETLSGGGGTALTLSWPLVRVVRSVTVDGLPAFGYGISELGVLVSTRGWARGHRNVVVEYEHGHDAPDVEIVRASKLRFKSLVLEGRSALPDRAERVVTVDQAGGSTVFSSPSERKTGIPAVDAVYAGFSPPQPGFG